MNLLKTVDVALGARSYTIEIGTELLAHCGEKIGALVKGRQAAVITDSNVGPLYAETVKTVWSSRAFR